MKFHMRNAEKSLLIYCRNEYIPQLRKSATIYQSIYQISRFSRTISLWRYKFRIYSSAIFAFSFDRGLYLYLQSPWTNEYASGCFDQDIKYQFYMPRSVCRTNRELHSTTGLLNFLWQLKRLIHNSGIRFSGILNILHIYHRLILLDK